MGKNNRSKNSKVDIFVDCNNLSLTDKYKELFNESANNGINVDEFLQRFGGKEIFLRYLQDIEDDVSDNQAEILKTAYSDGDVRRCVRAIANIAQKDYFVYKRGLRNSLYTEGNLLKNPLNYNFSQDDYEKTIKVLFNSMNYLDYLAEDKDSPVDKQMAEIYRKELLQLYYLYECLYHNRKQNEKRLSESRFLNHSLAQIIKSILTFFQNRYNLSRIKEIESLKEKGYITGFEIQVASKSCSQNPNVKISVADNFDQLIEDMDALIRYIYYLKASELEQSIESFSQLEYLTPFESPEYTVLDILALLDVWFAKLEASFRFSGWQIEKYKTQEGMLYTFEPGNDKAYKTILAATAREKHRFTIEAQIRMAEKASFSDTMFHGYILTSEKIDLKEIESFHFDKYEYSRLTEYMNTELMVIKRQSKPFYWTCRINDYYVEDYWNAYVFLYTFSKVYYCKASTDHRQETLVPIIHLHYLYNEFSSIAGYKYDLAKELIDCFVFNDKISKNKKYGDAFTRPLISIGEDAVLMSEALISQMNLRRNIEVLLDWNNVNLAPMGKELEKKLIRDLKNESVIKVNTNKIEFLAYDGRIVEFDFLAVLEDYLLLIEMKSLLRPYDDDELYRRWKTVSEGVDQVLRRVDIVKQDWKHIRAGASILLPDEPFDEEHIIKVVCTDVYNYTGLEDRGVIITDDATLLKYFLNPYIDGHLIDHGNSKIVQLQALWKNGKPSAQEFISYLRSPVTMSYIVESYEPEWKPLPILEGYYKVAFKDMAIKDDPMNKLSKIYGLFKNSK